MSKTYYLGIDIGGTKCAVIAGSEDMKILERIQFATETERGPQFAIDKLLVHAEEIVRNLEWSNLAAIGISCGGPLDSKQGIILSPPNLTGWDNIYITKIFKDRFEVPVYLQNDANACALAEFKFGAGRQTQNMIFLTFGTGLGAGMILNGQLYTGTNDLAGEVGHIRLEDDGPEGFGKKGSFEGFCSGAGITRLAKKILSEKIQHGETISFIHGEDDLQHITTKKLALAAVDGDENALEIFRISGKYLGKGLSILIDLINPEKIVIGGVYARHPQLFEEACYEVIEREAINSAANVCEIVPAALADQVGDYASLSVAMINNVKALNVE